MVDDQTVLLRALAQLHAEVGRVGQPQAQPRRMIPVPDSFTPAVTPNALGLSAPVPAGSPQGGFASRAPIGINALAVGPADNLATTLPGPPGTTNTARSYEISPNQPVSRRSPEGISHTPWGLRDDETGKWAKRK